MATKNIVPRADGEGGIGTQFKKWLKGWFKSLHVEGNITDETNSVTVGQLKTASDNQHTHSNKALLDTYTQTESDLEDAVNKKHSHTNKAVLDDIDVALTNELKSEYDDAVAKKHAHSNQSVLDNTQESFTTALKDKLDAIEAGAEVNVVTSVAGKTGDVTLSKTDVGLENVDNTSDANKPVSTAQQAALNLKVNIADEGYVTYLKLVSQLQMYLKAQGFMGQDDLIIPHQALNNNYVVIDKYGVPHWVVEIPRKNWDPVNTFASADIHPAFVVNGEQKRIFIGKYQLSEVSIGGNNRLVTWANQAVKHTINFDSMDTAINALNNGDDINGFHMVTNAEWALVALLCKYRNTMPYGNNNYGRDIDDKSVTGVLEAGSEANFGSASPARWLTGSGNNMTSHDRSEAGIFDLNGNIWEWVRGLRIANGEIHILENNNAADYTKSHGAASEEWKAILSDGTLVAPGTPNTLKYDGTSTIAVVETITTNSSPSTAFESVTTALSGAGIDLLKKLALLPYTSGFNSDRLYINNNEAERLPLRGGYWIIGSSAGVFSLYLHSVRTSANYTLGGRLAFVL